MGRLPDFLVLGAHKSGTSWLFQLLNAHPQIAVHEKLDFFLPSKKHRLSWESYSEMFPSDDSRILGELSTTYLFDSEAATLIAKKHPSAQLVAVLRHPVDRAFSHYKQELKMGMLPKNRSFAEALDDLPQIKLWGQYQKHLTSYLEHFNRDQIHLILYDDIRDQPLDVLKDLYSFLNVDPSYSPPIAHEIVNQARMPKSIKAETSVRKLGDRLQKFPWGKHVWSAVKRAGGKGVYHKINTNTRGASLSMHPNTRNALLDYYQEDIAFVKQLMNRPQLNWE